MPFWTNLVRTDKRRRLVRGLSRRRAALAYVVEKWRREVKEE